MIALRGQKRERRQRFVREQLSEFYAADARVQGAAQGARRTAVEGAHGGRFRMGAACRTDARNWHGSDTRIAGEALPEFQRIIEYDNKQLEESDIPVYRQMLDLFTSKMHLAEPINAGAPARACGVHRPMGAVPNRQPPARSGKPDWG